MRPEHGGRRRAVDALDRHFRGGGEGAIAAALVPRGDGCTALLALVQHACHTTAAAALTLPQARVQQPQLSHRLPARAIACYSLTCASVIPSVLHAAS